MHAEGLTWTIMSVNFGIDTQAVFLLECRQTYGHTDKVMDATVYLTHTSATVSVGNKSSPKSFGKAASLPFKAENALA